MDSRIYTYSASPVYTNWRNDNKLLHVINSMPKYFYKKMDFINGKRIVSISFTPLKGFFEINKENIKEPNIEFCKLIKNIFN